MTCAFKNPTRFFRSQTKHSHFGQTLRKMSIASPPVLRVNSPHCSPHTSGRSPQLTYKNVIMLQKTTKTRTGGSSAESGICSKLPTSFSSFMLGLKLKTQKYNGKIKTSQPLLFDCFFSSKHFLSDVWCCFLLRSVDLQALESLDGNSAKPLVAYDVSGTGLQIT